ncbi:hypothetical protein G6F62_011336 [Rhizopus arrhizus]|uniref:Protein S-acyltransferase n=4 Tax=Rhizopus TaxID=4842 RepID=I1C3S5_RHIO9|nr:hypothetical protein RO3G_07810 [Rhizopus delemar RA 99-880]KAG1035897.1 hypothetical protein G6F43_013155 [Rhizopus delemar]KAG1320430.1 hypothetical protein G6F62_011336 [Rhizopus arrhizus]KAG1396196.1 hypothetical protein G6F60_009771 [Rhizopus arrhizus]KAG1456855.1 hypothetical protein G6F55_006263 [Rhizopus delemar]|eukprot:EIE83105.1 hypothetical protein RO3G_07810 [Rhizopus delemar RA 99-880]
MVMIGVGILTGYHAYCITTNTTTIEGFEKGRSLTIKGMGRIQDVKKPYDQGIYQNLATVLGPYPIFWLLPMPMRGSGLDFPMRSISDLTEKSFSSTTRLNRPLSVETFYSTNHDIALLKEIPNIPETPGSTITFTSNTSTLV